MKRNNQDPSNDGSTMEARKGDSVSQAATVSTRYVDASGVRYAYRELDPENPSHPTPIVFLQRFRGTLDDWDPGFVDELAKTRHVILFSDAAVGSSTGSAATDVDQKARNVAKFVRALGYDTVDVLGFSMGRFVAQAIAITEPGLVPEGRAGRYRPRWKSLERLAYRYCLRDRNTPSLHIRRYPLLVLYGRPRKRDAGVHRSDRIPDHRPRAGGWARRHRSDGAAHLGFHEW